MTGRVWGFLIALVLLAGPNVWANQPGDAVHGHPAADLVAAAVRAPGVTESDGDLLAGPSCVVTSSADVSAGYRRPDQPPAMAAVAARRPRGVAVFLGDSYTSGWQGVGEGADGWPAILGAARHWTIHDLAVAGTGFVNPGWTGQPIGSQVGPAIQFQPGIVFVAGGHNDEDIASGPVATAADAVLDRLAAALPHAVIVVVGPIWPDGNPKATLVRLRDHLRARAAELGALFIDPIGDGWFAGSNERFIGPDGTHPTSTGYLRIARLVGAALETDPRLSLSLARDIVTPPAPASLPSSTVAAESVAGPAPCPS